MLAFYRTWLAITELEVPTIAAVNGAAVGAGLCLALACDLVYAAEDAKLLAPFTVARPAPRHGGHLPAAEGGGRRGGQGDVADRPDDAGRRGGRRGW